MKSGFQAFIFDLDGTLLDTEVLWVEATEAFLAARGLNLPHEDALHIVYGKAWSSVYRDLVARFPELDMSMPAMEAALRPFLLERRERTDVRIAGSIALLRTLAAQRPVCIVSGSGRRDVDAGIALAGIADCVAFSVASEDYDHGKPDPACFRQAAERLGVAPGACLVFEDSTAGVRAARAAGMRCVALARPGRPVQDLSAADAVVADLGDFSPARLEEGLP
jgi:HAD superfamily hydrolase (TIGR01509 family)